ncbi:MAG TPA: cation diffusion facilitator family transporter [Stenomitos sp.]
MEEHLEPTSPEVDRETSCEGHGPAHGHDHAHGHHHRAASQQALLIVLFLSLVYLVVEVVGGYLTNSLALLADAGHMFTDVAALGMSFAAMWIANRPPTLKRSFGYYRLEILAALMNGALLIVVAGGILYEMGHRLTHPPEVVAVPMMVVATGGLLVNLIGAWILSRSAHESLNVKGALAHVIGDALGSLGAIIAGALMWRFHWYVADPIISGVVGLLVLKSAWGLVTDSVDILLQSTPMHIDPAEVVHTIEAVPGVCASHDLHIWTVTSGMVSLTCHIVVTELSDSMAVLALLKETLHDRFGIEHATLQVEVIDYQACRQLHW